MFKEEKPKSSKTIKGTTGLLKENQSSLI